MARAYGAVETAEMPEVIYDGKNERRYNLVLGGLVAVACGLSATILSFTKPPTASEMAATKSAPSGRLSFFIHTPYQKREWEGFSVDTLPGEAYPFLANYHIVEPQRDSTISVTSHMSGNTNAEFSCSYSAVMTSGGGIYDELVGVTPAAEWSATGTVTHKSTTDTIAFPSPGNAEIIITCNFGGSEEAETRTENVKVFYVRRELRDLTDEDRDAFLDSFLVMANLPTEKGVKTFGRHYRSLTEFEIMHVRAAGHRSHDQIHDGMGVATQHIAMTSEFELSLQTISPRLTVPYWDYTKDSVMIDRWASKNMSTSDAVGQIFTKSKIFSNDWFGRTHEKLHTVIKGRFAFLEVPRDYNFGTRSPYGFLRAPWNINPSKYNTRYHQVCGLKSFNKEYTLSELTDVQWPTCSSHLKMSAEYDTWYEWVWAISYLPHGPVHAWTGGVGGECDKFTDLTERGLLSARAVDYIRRVAFLLLKNSWRYHYMETPKMCASDVPVEDCMWQCNIEEIGPDLWYNYTYHALIENANQTKDELYMHFDQNPEKFREIAHLIFCEKPYWPGDHLEAASPIDPSFWPIHPTLDRLLQYKDLIKPFKNEHWGTMAYDDNDVICQSMGGSLNRMEKYEHMLASNCSGHHWYDLTFWKLVHETEDGTWVKHHKNNLGVRDAALPNSKKYVLPYIYNHFQWPHCDSVNVNFPEVGSKLGFYDEFCSDEETYMQIVKGTYAFNSSYLDSKCTAKAAASQTSIMRYSHFNDGAGLRNAVVSVKFASSGTTEVSVNGYGKYKHDGSRKWLKGFACSKMGEDTKSPGRLLIEYKELMVGNSSLQASIPFNWVEDEWYTLQLQYDKSTGTMKCRAQKPDDPAVVAEVSLEAEFVNEYPGNHTEGVGLTTSVQSTGNVYLDWFKLIADRASV